MAVNPRGHLYVKYKSVTADIPVALLDKLPPTSNQDIADHQLFFAWLVASLAGTTPLPFHSLSVLYVLIRDNHTMLRESLVDAGVFRVRRRHTLPRLSGVPHPRESMSYCIADPALLLGPKEPTALLPARYEALEDILSAVGKPVPPEFLLPGVRAETRQNYRFLADWRPKRPLPDSTVAVLRAA